MNAVATRKCVRHVTREAVARCPACSEHFCRECVVEHDGILLCAPCLALTAAKNEARRRTNWAPWQEFFVTATCVLLLWVAFYSLGQLLKAIPADLHEGTLWHMAPGS